MPILVRPKPFLPRRCLRGIYAGLARLSAGCPPDKGRLHTCYSPVRHSPAGGASSSPAAVRLACVKPAASVHPEPGSNSPLLNIYFSIYLRIFVCPASLIIRMMFLTETLSLPRVPLSLLRLTRGSALLVLWHHVIVLNLFRSGEPVSASGAVPFVSRLRMQNYCLFRRYASFFEKFLCS